MHAEDDLRAAVAAGVLAAAKGRAPLLQSIADVARAIFGARASSIMLFDAAGDELVFEAVSGEGEELLGRRLPKDTGIAGWVVGARDPIVVEDVSHDPRFAADIARGTGYIPHGIMAAPLLLDERVLGVLSILDRPSARPPASWSSTCWDSSPIRPRSPSSCSRRRAARRWRWTGAASWPRWPGSPRSSMAVCERRHAWRMRTLGP